MLFAPVIFLHPESGSELSYLRGRLRPEKCGGGKEIRGKDNGVKREEPFLKRNGKERKKHE